MRPAAIVHALFVCFPAIAGAAFVPVGAEFQINTYTSSDQQYASVSAGADGDFVVVWQSFQDGYGIFGQRYDSAGNVVGSEFQINSYTGDAQRRPSVSADSEGRFVVAWTSEYRDGSEEGVFGQRFSSEGAPVGSEFQVNTYTFSYQARPSVSAHADGDFVVVWQSYQDGDGYGIFGQRFSSGGAPVGSEFQVNTYTPFTQDYASVSAHADGDFVVVWQSIGISSIGISGQRYDSSGAPVGTEFQVNTYTMGAKTHPSVSADANGGFVVVWRSDGQDGESAGVFGQRYDSAGAAVGSEFQVNSYTMGYQGRPSVTVDGEGAFVVVWPSDQDGSSFGVFGQRYDSAGAAVGSEFQVNSYTTGCQCIPVVAGDAGGNFVVAWQSAGQDGHNEGVFGQRFGQGCPPVALSGCGVPEKSIVLFKEKTDPSKNKFLWKWLKGTADTADFGDPLTSTAFDLCLYDDGAPVMFAGVEPGGTCGTKDCWKATGAKGFAYKNKSSNKDGITQLKLKSGTGKAKILLKGKGADLSMPLPITQSTLLRAQLSVRDGAECWQSSFEPPATKNEPDLFKDKQDGPGPVCGNGVVEALEVCDGGDDAACPGTCLPDCTCAPCNGESVGGYCWYLGAGVSCDDTCAAEGLACAAATVTYAGSGGTDANCEAVLNALGFAGPLDAPSADCGADGLGCSYSGIVGETLRCATPPTTCGASLFFVARACACQ